MSNNLGQISAIVGAFLPLAIAVIQKTDWSQAVKSIVALAACVVAALITVAIEGNFNFDDIVTSLSVVYALAMVSYHSLWKPTNVAPAIQAKTPV
jgi:uncharacterized membrane protein YoaK (UPF0700 family)